MINFIKEYYKHLSISLPSIVQAKKKKTDGNIFYGHLSNP